MEKTLAKRIIKTRSSLGWSQADLAQASGIAAAQISRYEQGRNIPRPEVLAKLAKALNVSFEWLSGATHQQPEALVQLGHQDAIHVELDLPDELLSWIHASAKTLGVSSEDRILQLLQQSIDAEKSSSGIIPLDSVLQRLTALEERTKELARRVPASDVTPPKTTDH